MLSFYANLSEYKKDKRSDEKSTFLKVLQRNPGG